MHTKQIHIKDHKKKQSNIDNENLIVWKITYSKLLLHTLRTVHNSRSAQGYLSDVTNTNNRIRE